METFREESSYEVPNEKATILAALPPTVWDFKISFWSLAVDVASIIEQ